MHYKDYFFNNAFHRTQDTVACSWLLIIFWQCFILIMYYMYCILYVLYFSMIWEISYNNFIKWQTGSSKRLGYWWFQFPTKHFCQNLREWVLCVKDNFGLSRIRCRCCSWINKLLVNVLFDFTPATGGNG